MTVATKNKPVSLVSHQNRFISSTPSFFKMWAGGICIAMMLACALAYMTLDKIETAIQTIGYDTKPSVVVALNMQSVVSEMDADVINAAVYHNGDIVGASKTFLDLTGKLNDFFMNAVKNITYGEKESIPLKNFAYWNNRYHEEIGRLENMNNQDPNYLEKRLTWSSDVIHLHIIPELKNLEKANVDPMEDEWQSFQQNTSLSASIVIFLFAGVLCAVFWNQKIMAYRTKRIVNIPYVLASVLLVGIMLFSVNDILSSKKSLKIAKEDAYDSVYALNQLKINVDDMNGQESLWLIDKENRQIHADAFDKIKANILPLKDEKSDDWKNFPSWGKTTLEAEQLGERTQAKNATPKFGGEFGVALANITFGLKERKPITEAFANYQEYLKIDQKIREMEKAGNHTNAFEMAIENKPGRSQYYYQLTISNIDEAIKVNDDVFDEKVKEALNQTKFAKEINLLGLPLVIGLILMGSFQRIRQYR